jgi:hypothetical protein
MTISFSHKAIGHILEAVDDSDVWMKVSPQVFESFVRPGGDVYALIRGPVNREIVKIDASGSLNENLKVDRGQGGTSANAWPLGALLFNSTNEDHYNSIIQRGENRVIDYNPNQVLSPLYAGEKIYQDSPAGCERWWVSFNGTDPYWDIFTGQACGDEYYQDIGWDYDLLLPVPGWSGWLDVTGPSYWTLVLGNWDGSKYTTEFTDPYYDLRLEPDGTWHANQEPTKIRVTFTGQTYIELFVRDQDEHDIFADVGYKSLEEKDFNYYNPPTDIKYILLRGFPNPLEITKVEMYSP